jgi:hypothetical protein
MLQRSAAARPVNIELFRSTADADCGTPGVDAL